MKRLFSRREFFGCAALAAASIKAARGAAVPRELTAAVIGHTNAGDYGHGLDLIFKNLPRVRTAAVAESINKRDGQTVVIVESGFKTDQSDKQRKDPQKILKEASALSFAEASKHRIGAERAYPDYHRMLAEEKPQLVSVAPRWTEEHFAMVKAALEVGAHVFCEKPFTTTLREADELLALAEKSGLRIAVAHQMRMAPNVVALKEKIANGLIGEIVEMRAFGKQDARAGGEDMLVLGTHLFDLMRMFAGDARRCSATVWWKGELARLDDRRKATEGIGFVLGDEIEARFEFDRGVTGTFTSRGKLREATGRWRLELIGTRGSAMILADIDPDVLLLNAGKFSTEGRKDEWTPFAPLQATERGIATANRRLALDWLKAIEENREPICSAANATKAIEMVMAVYEAHLSGRRVDLPMARREHPLGV